MKPKLYYLGQPGDGYGWGIANTNLVAALSNICDVELAPANRKRFGAPILAPIAGSDLKPEVSYRAPRVLGYCFTEWPLPGEAKRNARAYDVIFAGSSWNAQRLLDAGIRNVEVLLQGIDHDRFKPLPPSERKGFVIFSGGKYEFRKGQDYVIDACRRFLSVHSDAILMAAWHNPWEASKASMKNSWLIDASNPFKDLPTDRFFPLPAVPNAKTPEVYQQAHIGLFPNRCEAGTNLVMCEFMACNRTVIATYAHGHRDVFDPAYPLLLKNGSYDPAHWFNCNTCDILNHLEWAYQHRDQLPGLAAQCRGFTDRLTWGDCAAKIYRAAFGSEPPDRVVQPPVPSPQSAAVPPSTEPTLR